MEMDINSDKFETESKDMGLLAPSLNSKAMSSSKKSTLNTLMGKYSSVPAGHSV
jgi:hypothetical protein